MSTTPTLKLTLVKDQKKTEIYFQSFNFALGRNSDFSDLCSHSSISKNHLNISVIGQQIYLEDNWSSNGTHLNNKLLPYNQQVRYQKGDQITLGSAPFHFTLELIDYDPTLLLREIKNADTQMNEGENSKLIKLSNVAELNIKKIFYFVNDYKFETIISLFIMLLIIYYIFVR